MRHFLEAGATMTGKVVWVKADRMSPIAEGTVLMPHEPEFESEDYRGIVDAVIAPRLAVGVIPVQMMLPHREHASGARYWIYKGEESEADKTAIQSAGYDI